MSRGGARSAGRARWDIEVPSKTSNLQWNGGGSVTGGSSSSTVRDSFTSRSLAHFLTTSGMADRFGPSRRSHDYDNEGQCDQGRLSVKDTSGLPGAGHLLATTWTMSLSPIVRRSPWPTSRSRTATTIKSASTTSNTSSLRLCLVDRGRL